MANTKKRKKTKKRPHHKETAICPVALISISHRDLRGPIHLAMNENAITSCGRIFLPFNFDFQICEHSNSLKFDLPPPLTSLKKYLHKAVVDIEIVNLLQPNDVLRSFEGFRISRRRGDWLFMIGTGERKYPLFTTTPVFRR